MTLPRDFFGAALMMGEVDELISFALAHSGYVEKSYYALPYRGFAMVTRLEQIEDDGAPMAGGERWSLVPQTLQRFSLSDYLDLLLRAKPGYYRLVVFIVTLEPFYQSGRRITGEEAMEWLSFGLTRLPRSLAMQRYAPHGDCTALVYEFRRRQGKPDLLVPSRFNARTHLERTGIWTQLGKR